jgi:hypothetical protein
MPSLSLIDFALEFAFCTYEHLLLFFHYAFLFPLVQELLVFFRA